MKAEPPRAWQPLTFGGVARYAHDWVGRLVVTCLVFSLLTAAATVWTVRRAWFPVVEQAIAHLPPGAEIRGGHFKAAQGLRLAENSFLAIEMDPNGDFRLGSTADLQITLAPGGIQFRSLFGRSEIPYRLEWTLVLSRAEMDPWWSAWRPAMLGYVAGGTMIGLFASWIALGIVYSMPLFLFGQLLRRSVTPWGAWKASVAALMPGAIFMSIALVLYASGALRLAELLAAFLLHFAIGWIFLFGAAFWLPRKSENLATASESDDTESDNPFSGSNATKEE